MQTVFRGPVHVSYSQIYVESRVEDFFDELTESRGGQANGLCGAAVPGMLFLTTGLHTGEVELTIEVHEDIPPLTAEWEDVVEVSFRPASEQVALLQWGGTKSWPLRLTPRNYRVRYCARGMDQGRERDTRLSGEPLYDHYLLQFWPGPPAPDRVLRQAARSPGTGTRSPANSRPRPRRRRGPRPNGLRRWPNSARGSRHGTIWKRAGGAAGRPASGSAASASWSAAQLDRDLVDAVAEVDEDTLRAVARWAARRAMVEAGLASLIPVDQALAALDRGDDLPPPFHDHTSAWDVLTDGSVPITTVVSWDGRHERISQQHAAIPALLSAAETDPLSAALGAIWHAGVTFGAGHPRLLADLRIEFPQPGTSQ